MRWLSYYAVITAFLLFFVLGYSYFYPHNSPLATQSWFAMHVVPRLDVWLVKARAGQYSGRLLFSDGELKFKSEADFVFYPVRPGQRFFGKTMISSGAQSLAEIEVAEGVQVQLGASSILVIEPPREGQGEATTVRVIGGAVVAKASKKATQKVRLISVVGAEKIVDQKGVTVVVTETARKTYLAEVSQEVVPMPAPEIVQWVAPEPLVTTPEPLVRQQALPLEAKKQVDLKLQNIVIQESETVSKAQAEASKGEGAIKVTVPLKIMRRKFNDELVRSAKEAPRTIVANGLYEAKQGNKEAATRSFASALSSPLYLANESFSPSVQVALDGMLESYESTGSCAMGRDTLRNSLKQYETSAAAQSWGKTWSTRFETGRCKDL